jgi:outer membrane protein TolC
VDLSPLDRDLSPAALTRPTDTLPQWLARALEHRPETRAYRENLEGQEHQAEATRWSVWGPQLGAGITYGQVGTYPDTLGEHENWLVTLGWTFSFGGPGRIQAADARTEQATIALMRFQDKLQGQVAAAYQEVVLARQRLDPAERESASAEKALRLARVNFEGGLLPENDLLLAQQAADQARQKRLTAVTRFNVAQIHLLAEAGVGSIDTLSGGAGK